VSCDDEPDPDAPTIRRRPQLEPMRVREDVALLVRLLALDHRRAPIVELPPSAAR
jgi:hypothetical protein